MYPLLYLCSWPLTYRVSTRKHRTLNLRVSPFVCVCAFQVDHSDMRVSLTLKPNSRPDFGFQTHWDSTGARVKFIQPGKTLAIFNSGLLKFWLNNITFMVGLDKALRMRPLLLYCETSGWQVSDGNDTLCSQCGFFLCFFFHAFSKREICCNIPLLDRAVIQNTDRSQHWRRRRIVTTETHTQKSVWETIWELRQNGFSCGWKWAKKVTFFFYAKNAECLF